MATAQCCVCGRFIGKGNIRVVKWGGYTEPAEYEGYCIDCWLKEYKPRFGPPLYPFRP